MAQDRTTREIEIIANGQKFNSSLKEMTSAQNVLNSQIQKMATNDPRRAALIKDFQEMKRRAAEARAEIHGVSQAQGFLKQAMASTLGNFLGGGLLGAVQGIWSSVSGFLKDSTEKFNTQAQAVAQLEATLKSTGNSAGFTSKELQDMASQLQGKTLFGDEATIQAQALLLTFTDIKKGVFEDAMPAIQDMAQKMAGDGPADLKGATIQVGKALNDPIKGISALSKVGVSFTEEQKATIKTMQEMGNKASAQKLILAELNKEFGGSAEAARKAGTGGWTAFMNTVGDLQEIVGGFISKGLNKMGNFFSELVEKSDPLINVFKELWNGVSDIYSIVADVIDSLGLFTSETSMAENVIYGLKVAFQVLLTPIKTTVFIVKGLIEGFVTLYNRSEMVRGVVGGLSAAVVSSFTSIKNAAVNILGGVGDLLVGIFTLDPAKIKSGLSKAFKGVVDDIGGSGIRAGFAFADGYQNSKDKRIVLNNKKDKEQAEATVAAAAATGEASANAETAAQKKTREKADKEAKKAREKAQKEEERAREEFHKASEKAEIELAKLKVEIMQDGIDKVLAKLRLQHQLEKEELDKRKNEVVANLAATESEKQALLDNLAEQQRLKDEELKAAEEKAQEDEKKRLEEEAAKKLEEKLAKHDADEELKAAQAENTFLNDQARLDDQTLRALEAEQARDLAMLELKRATAQAKLADMEVAGQGEALAAIKLKNEILKTDKEIADTKIANAKRTSEFKAEMIQKEMGYYSSLLDATIQFFGADEAARKKNASLIKAFSGAKVMVDLTEEIAGIWKNANSNPINAIIPGAGNALAAIQTAAAFARAKSAVSNIQAQQFYGGGATGPRGGSRALIKMVERGGMWEMASGYSGGSIGTFADGGFVNDARLGLIGERGAELVIPNWMINSPKYANTVSWLESERVKGATAFAEGGATSQMPAPTTLQVQDEEMKAFMAQLLFEFRDMKTEVTAWPHKLQVHNNVSDTYDQIQVRNELVEMSGA
ncbi:phage tail protein [Rufibacter roseus]|uniref:Bacteriophage tail tape measure N-terminal domain-containing protein n=1 Tax=Rufibacter roseus TaxID=1567108 RepID=A0ABW2DSV6_9BACT|nr:hypothetical protein [Rufibacter roseus]